jgi:hypothetical protein
MLKRPKMMAKGTIGLDIVDAAMVTGRDWHGAELDSLKILADPAW